MYLPAHFREDDHAALLALMRAHPFATLVTVHEGAPFATHLPLLIDERGGEVRLLGHVARANPQWTHFEDRGALAIFHGPHALVHPGWYAAAPNVPTWNYAVVHAAGRAALLEGDAALDVARRLTATFTPDAPPISDAFERKLIGGVVTFELRVQRLQGKFKLSQNRNETDQRNVTLGLGEGDELERRTADLMRARHERTS